MENNEESAEQIVPQNGPDLAQIQQAVERIKSEIRKVLVGQDELVNLMIAALLCKGHVIIEGVPGIAKTLTANLLSKTLNLDFSRIQFTPDLMPADVTGTTVFNIKNSEFEMRKGPIFANIVLIDEINRAPAKTQASLFEVMEERQITVDGTTYKLDSPFMVMATQNPIEQEGTYKLPEAQQDRFVFKIIIGYPSAKEELEILQRFKNDFSMNAVVDIKQVLSRKELEECQHLVEKIHIGDDLLEYIAMLIDKTRNHPDLFLGASPRASIAIMKSAKAFAGMMGRGFVTPDDIRYVTFPVLNHRLILTPDAEMEGRELKIVINEILGQVEVPR